MDNIKVIREQERKHHDECYESYQLFEQGSWLHKPVKSLMDLIPLLEDKENLKILDLGAGVGRNSIPIAKALKKNGVKVVCVDLLDSAINHLRNNSKQHDVEQEIIPVKADIDNYKIFQDTYDLILAVSSLEHISNEPMLDQVLDHVAEGTEIGGINGIIINSEVQEIDRETGKKLEAFIELNLSTKEIIEKLKKHFHDWKWLKQIVRPQEYLIKREEREVILKTKAITFIARKRKG
ncbi:class I SAM-dependent methyltransferase [Gracilibacillus dipsosauri]|uniref:class I SAM-dependent methyltransferase n=1 Tax=Gracilibacillus dipsosauri TaxID=178340 RepID=UPI0024096981